MCSSWQQQLWTTHNKDEKPFVISTHRGHKSVGLFVQNCCIKHPQSFNQASYHWAPSMALVQWFGHYFWNCRHRLGANRQFRLEQTIFFWNCYIFSFYLFTLRIDRFIRFLNFITKAVSHVLHFFSLGIDSFILFLNFLVAAVSHPVHLSC